MRKITEFLKQIANMIIGFAILSIILPPISILVGFVVNQIVDAFKFGYGLW